MPLRVDVDNRLVGIGQHGVVYTGGVKKIAEHGGNDLADRNVPLIVSGPTIHRGTRGLPVDTTQIAPTILHLLDLDTHDLIAVRIDHTSTLPTN